jgi:hypothetical protein
MAGCFVHQVLCETWKVGHKPMKCLNLHLEKKIMDTPEQMNGLLNFK